MSPEEEYQLQIREYGYLADPAQASAIAGLDALYHRLTGRTKQPIGVFKTLGINLGLLSPSLIPGCYLWGGVGRGKTWLMDLFFENLPMTEKYRIHFHQFILMVTDEL